jgi:two-component system response regulator NreC
MAQADDHTARVVLVDAHPMVLLSAGMVLSGEGIEVVAATAQLDLAVRVAKSGRANVLVMDLWRRDGSPYARIADLRRALPTTAIVILTMEAEAASATAAIAAGAGAYVMKDRAELELGDAVRAAADGRVFISDAVTPVAAAHAA